MTKAEIEDKIKNLTPKQMIMAMVDGLRKRHVCITMSSYGFIDNDNICYGCAATNALCELGCNSTELPSFNSEDGQGFSEGGLFQMISNFESLVDTLRNGGEHILFFNCFNSNCRDYKLQNLKLKFFGFEEELPYLGDNYTEEQLQVYERLANFQES